MEKFHATEMDIIRAELAAIRAEMAEIKALIVLSIISC